MHLFTRFEPAVGDGVPMELRKSGRIDVVVSKHACGSGG